MSRFQRVLLLAALGAWTVIGAARLWRQAVTSPRAPAWAAVLAPLATAPLPPGSAVALLAPPAAGGRQALKPLLMEAAWQRPDLRWAFLDEWPGGTTPELLAVVAGAVPSAEWHEVWHRGAITVYRAGRS